MARPAAAALPAIVSSILPWPWRPLVDVASSGRRRYFTSSRLSFRLAASSYTSSASAAAAVTSDVDSDGNGKILYDRLLPCPSQSCTPRIEHIVAQEEDIALNIICKSLNLPSHYVADLIRFGAVYFALVCPRPPSTATPEEFKIFEEVTKPSVLQKRPSIKGKTVREAQKTYRVTDPKQYIEAGTYLRVHVHPKRFPRCYEIDWRSRVIAVTDSYVVIDKPAGTSVGGATDNIEESCVTFMSRALGFKAPLMTTHQIDNCTEGCVVLARTKDYCSVFHRLIREKKVRKLYLALAASPVPMGVISHFMRPVNLAPRLLSEDFIPGWHLCQLEVLDCKKVPWPKLSVRKAHNIEDCAWNSQDAAYECKVNLLTGKTHQIRAQFAAVGAPIIGDSMYMPAAFAATTNPSINPYGRGRNPGASKEETAVAVATWVAHHGKEPTSAIGLQASQISWSSDGGSDCSYEAGVPWWRH